MLSLARRIFLFLLLPAILLAAERRQKSSSLWSLELVSQPTIPEGVTNSKNPIDAFVGEVHKEKGLRRAGPAGKLALLRRLYLDLIGLPPTPAEQDAFLQDPSPQAYEEVVDRLLASPQHGVRYARHWLDVLRFADIDENMPASPGLYLWRDWVISALNQDLPYDAFVRAQITGNRSKVHSTISATGHRSKIEPRPDDVFALGFLARGAASRDDKGQELAISAVETISSAFLGMTVGCAKCHDHFYDPITQRDYYAMKALFDPLVLRRLVLATPAEIFARGTALDEYEAKRVAIEGPLNALIEPYRKKLYEERVAMLPADIQAVVRKPEKEQTAAEQKIADDYYPILRIDPPKIKAIMPRDEAQHYDALQKQLNQLQRPADMLSFWTVEEDPKRLTEKSYILTSGDPQRPEKDKEVQPGFPFMPKGIDFREGRREGFVDWLTASENPLFARVAVNRIWRWHFGEGLQRAPSDFGTVGGKPTNPKLLDWLASEFVAHNYSMKWLHRIMVTSETYQRASDPPSALMAANSKIDPKNQHFWCFDLRRLEAEAIWDAVLYAAGDLDMSVGGKSFRAETNVRKQPGISPETNFDVRANRRGAYMARGHHSSTDAMPHFLQAFDADDGRTSCPQRNQTVTAPQSLLLMNSDAIEKASNRLAERLAMESGGDLRKSVDLGYKIALGRSPSASERDKALSYIEDDRSRLKGFAWLLFNLDEFIFVR